MENLVGSDNFNVRTLAPNWTLLALAHFGLTFSFCTVAPKAQNPFTCSILQKGSDNFAHRVGGPDLWLSQLHGRLVSSLSLRVSFGILN
jgi:hypothetical protein